MRSPLIKVETCQTHKQKRHTFDSGIADDSLSPHSSTSPDVCMHMSNSMNDIRNSDANRSHKEQSNVILLNWMPIPPLIPDPFHKIFTQTINFRQKSEAVTIFLSFLRTVVRKDISCKKIRDVWTGYEKDKPGLPVFVVMVDEKQFDIPKTYASFKIVQKTIRQVSSEAKDIMDMENDKNLTFTSQEQENIRKCIAKHSKRLMDKHSNLKIVSASKIRSKNYNTPEQNTKFENCIVLYVDVKGIIPFNEDVFPTFLESDGTKFPVDVREGYFTLDTNPAAPGEYQAQLTMGCKITNEYNQSATLGAVVRLPGGKVGALTCWHMFNTERAFEDYQKDVLHHRNLKTDVYQPSVHEQNRFGKIVAAYDTSGDENDIGVDAGLIEITDTNRTPQSGGFPKTYKIYSDAFSQTEIKLEFNSGDMFTSFEEVSNKSKWTVIKFGAETGMTTGRLRMVGAAVSTESSRRQLHQQIEIEPKPGSGKFSEPGDSGSPVFLIQQLDDASPMYAVGMHIGSTSFGTAIASPIWAVLKGLELPVQLLSFENPRIQRLERDVDRMNRNMNERFDQLEDLIKGIGSKTS